MNQLAALTTQQTISSIELVAIINDLREEGKAELRHDHFTTKVEKVLGLSSPEFLGHYQHQQNKQFYVCYNLPKREASLMVMSESYAVQAKVYDRMVELEKELNKVEFYIPKTFAEALRLAADTEERNIALQQNVLLLENKVEIQKPAVEFVESYVEKGFNVCLSDGWKSLGMKPNLFTKQLLGDGILFRRGKSKNVLAKQCHINSGYFCERITEFGTQTLITPKGLLYISQKYRINPSASILDMMH